MNSRKETVLKFSGALNIDMRKDVRYGGRVWGPHRCVCGQPIQYGYLFINKRNYRECVVGKNCLNHITWYLDW